MMTLCVCVCVSVYSSRCDSIRSFDFPEKRWDENDALFSRTSIDFMRAIEDRDSDAMYNSLSLFLSPCSSLVEKERAALCVY